MIDLSAAVLEHANRGVRLQLVIRVVLVVFVALTVILIPPVQGAATCYALVAIYALAAVAIAAWAWRGGQVVARWAWTALFVDLLMVGTLTLLTGVSADESWTSDVIVHGCFVLPILAATQLRPGVCAAVVVPTVIVYLVSSVATQAANEEPWQSILLRTLVLVAIGTGCVGLSRIQRSRVAAISRLLRDRDGLLDDLVQLEERERRDLSERLHDGALQYVLAARLDLDDVRDGSDPTALTRIEQALVESSRLLRSTVADLHPAVLERAGLGRAVRDLAESSARADLAIEVDLADWPDEVRLPADPLLYGAARELLSNVIKHADATAVLVTLRLVGDTAHLTIADDGRGITDEAVSQSVDRGHIGLYSQRLRVEAAGGTLAMTARRPGTVATVSVPAVHRRRRDDAQGADEERATSAWTS
jgi:two-component system NarL family sensor kinase